MLGRRGDQVTAIYGLRSRSPDGLGMCRHEGCGFQTPDSYTLSQSKLVWVQKRVSFSRKLIDWLTILVQAKRTGNCRLKKQKNQISKFKFTQPKRYSTIGGIWGVQSCIGQQNSAELSLVQAKGSQGHIPTPKFPKLTPSRPPTGPRERERDYCCRNENFTVNQKYPARSVKSINSLPKNPKCKGPSESLILYNGLFLYKRASHVYFS